VREYQAREWRFDRTQVVEGLALAHRECKAVSAPYTFDFMIVLSTLAWIAFGLSLIAMCWWGAVMIRLVRLMCSGISVRKGLEVDVDEAEWVSIIIPAHNEERVLAKCLDTALAQDWPSLEVIVCLDRCTDASEAIAVARAEADDRLKVIRIDSCPPTWAGKCNAASKGAQHAKGAWLLMLDADTDADPQLVRALVGEGTRRDAALLSLLTDLNCTTWFERVSQPVATMVLMQAFPPDKVNRDDHNRPFANGQCMLFRREWYDRIGGHSAVQDDLLEDLAFSRCIDLAGGRVRVLSADGMLGCSMYGNWNAFRQGWTRIFLEACGRNTVRLRRFARRQELLGAGPPIFMASAITFGLLASNPIAWITGIALIVVQLSVLAVIYSHARQPMWCTVLFPIGCFEVARAQRRARRLLLTGTPVCWGGREYVISRREPNANIADK
jgi:chlorobactene glucosyltransferase